MNPDQSQIINQKIMLKHLIKEDVFGFWFEAEIQASQSPCLLICYRKSLLTSELIKKLMLQAEALIDLKHEQLLRLLDYGYDGEIFYTVHEPLKQSVPLDEWISTQKTWPLKRLWKFTAKLIKLGLYVERKNLHIGTLSLSNLYVNDKGDVFLARLLLPTLIVKEQSAELAYLDDALFYAPEVYLHTTFNLQADLYSLGIILYYFFSQKWPYAPSYSIEEVQKSLLKKQQPFVACHEKLPRQINYIVQTCLKLDASNRYASFSELLAAYRRNDLNKNPFIKHEHNFQKELSKQLKNDQSKRIKRTLGWSVSAALILFFLALIYAVYIYYVTSIPTFPVPNLKNLSQEEGLAVLDRMGFESSVAGAYISKEVAKGQIVSTKPPFGRLVKKNRHIRLFISKGLAEIRVPDLKGMSDLQAQQLLEDLSLRVPETQEAYSNEYAAGYVIAQYPSPNYMLSPSSNIQLVLSKGFPVEVWRSQSHFDFFKRRRDSKQVKIKFMVLPEWEAQKVSIYFRYKDQFQKIYEELHEPNNVTTLEFELESQGTLTAFFNEEKAFEKQVSLIKEKEKHEQPF